MSLVEFYPNRPPIILQWTKLTKLRPEGPENNFCETLPSHPLSQGLDVQPLSSFLEAVLSTFKILNCTKFFLLLVQLKILNVYKTASKWL